MTVAPTNPHVSDDTLSLLLPSVGARLKTNISVALKPLFCSDGRTKSWEHDMVGLDSSNSQAKIKSRAKADLVPTASTVPTRLVAFVAISLPAWVIIHVCVGATGRRTGKSDGTSYPRAWKRRTCVHCGTNATVTLRHQLLLMDSDSNTCRWILICCFSNGWKILGDDVAEYSSEYHLRVWIPSLSFGTSTFLTLMESLWTRDLIPNQVGQD